MKILRTRGPAFLIALALCLTLVGCYEDEAVVTINVDGSGSFSQTIQMSERLVVAVMSEDGGEGFSSDAPFEMTRSEFEAKLGRAGKITAFDLQDRDDGGKTITLAGTFDDVAVFMQSAYASDTLKLSADVEADGQAVVRWLAQEDADNGPSLDQLYGLAKGMRVVRRVQLPSAPTSEHGTVEGNRVEWAMDLTNREGLEATKATLGASEGGVLVAHFDPGSITFQAAEPAAGETSEGQQPAVADAPVDTSGMSVELNAVSWTRVAAVSEDAYVQDPTLNFDLELTWPEGSRPLAVYAGELMAISDDRGNSLLPESNDDFGQRRSDIWEHSDTETFRLEAVGPDRSATAITGLAGQVRVVTQVNVETISLDNPAALVGQAATGNQTLDAMGFKIKAVNGSDLELTFNEGVEATAVIQSLSATLPDGTPIENNGWGGWANNMTYNFPQDISAMTNLTLKILTGETVVAVPFSFDKIDLP
ncbi:MAG: hypothetical protein AAF086_08880 [Planctomycetota bacterium]